MNIHIPIAQLKKKKITTTLKCLVPVPHSRVNHPSFGVSCIILVSFLKKKIKRGKKRKQTDSNVMKLAASGENGSVWLR